MRNFITTFLLLILFISIFSAIFAPKNTKKSLEEESNNKSRVEKLLTEPNQSFKVEDEQKVEAKTQQKPIEKVPEIKVLNKNNLPDKTIDNTAQTKDAEKISIPKNSKELSDEILDRNQITKNEIVSKARWWEGSLCFQFLPSKELHIAFYVKNRNRWIS